MGSYPHVSNSFPANDNFSSFFRNKKSSPTYPSFPNFARDVSLAPPPRSAQSKPTLQPTMVPTSPPMAPPNSSANQLFQGSTSIQSNFVGDWNEMKDPGATSDPPAPSDADNEDGNFIIVQRIGAGLRQLTTGIAPGLFKRIFECANPRDRFRIAWWFIIFSSAQRASFVEQLSRLGFTAPP